MRYRGRFYGQCVPGRGMSPVSVLRAEIRAPQILWHYVWDRETKHTISSRKCNAAIVKVL